MVKLSREDVAFLLRTVSMKQHLIITLKSIANGGEIKSEIADELRDLVGEELQVSGFNKTYEVNDKGRRLETLVDKLFVG